MKLQRWLIVIALLALPAIAAAGDVTLAWDPITSPLLAGYTLCYGNVSGHYHTAVDVGNVTTYTVSHLAVGTYYFAVKAYGSAGEQSGFSNEVTTVLCPPTGCASLVLPRFAAGQNVLGAGTAVGMALANLSLDPVTLTFTAMEEDGTLTTGPNITNPATRDLNAGEQLPVVDWQIFGYGLSNLSSNGWIKLESVTAGTSGFFLIFDGAQSLMDGANFPNTKLTDFAFTEIQAGGYNKISIINDNSDDAAITLNLVKADGTLRSSRSRVINKNGSLTADLFSDLFTGISPDAGDYVRVHSSKGVQSVQVMRQNSGDIAALVAQNAVVGGTTLYSPQYVVGGGYRTSLSIINLDSTAGTATLRFVGEDGTQIGATRVAALPANGKLYIDDPGFFLAPGAGVDRAGYVEIVSNGIKLAGSTAFGDRNGQTFYSALALISKLQTSAVFGHVASNDLYFTGIAILNPGAGADATVTLELYSADGTLLQQAGEVIEAGRRQARLLTEYFPSLVGQNQTSGYVRLTSDKPIASFALFGTQNLSVLAAIPPQQQPRLQIPRGSNLDQ